MPEAIVKGSLVLALLSCCSTAAAVLRVEATERLRVIFIVFTLFIARLQFGFFLVFLFIRMCVLY